MPREGGVGERGPELGAQDAAGNTEVAHAKGDRRLGRFLEQFEDAEIIERVVAAGSQEPASGASLQDMLAADAEARRLALEAAC